MKRNIENFRPHLLNELDYSFSVIGITEAGINQLEISDFNPSIPNYNFENVPTFTNIHKSLNYKIIEKTTNEAFPALWIEIIQAKHANIICGVIYRLHNSPERFQVYLKKQLRNMQSLGNLFTLWLTST